MLIFAALIVAVDPVAVGVMFLCRVYIWRVGVHVFYNVDSRLLCTCGWGVEEGGNAWGWVLRVSGEKLSKLSDEAEREGRQQRGEFPSKEDKGFRYETC